MFWKVKDRERLEKRSLWFKGGSRRMKSGSILEYSMSVLICH
ncbi:MAG: hypothetical protein XD50_0019 [Clostridia bacterium 41_269]|nr:MAG: hypothetical protein XD50_0019 [Clostridia bacterium 41_269]